jgi:sterol desaturase/sphingolipid hydroxylase (fatty acid hydroxylase superfamily)
MGEQALNLLQQAYVVATVGSFGFLITLEAGAVGAPASRRRWRHVLRNLGLYGCAVVIADILIRAQGLDLATRLTESHGLLTPLALPALAQFFIAFLLIDLFDYSLHRLQHRWRWLWLIHAVHHSDTELDASTGVRFHPLESVIHVSLLTVLMLALGLPLWVLIARAVFQNPIDFMQHANLRFPDWVERRLGWLLVTPIMHRVHHSRLPIETNSNYGGVLSIWDKLFGTYTPASESHAATQGLGKLVEDSWQTVVGMLLTPLRARRLGTL